jgi:hypothetical protein
VHLAGAEFEHGYWLDAHSGALDPDLVALATDVVADLPNLGALIFEIAPSWFARFGEAAFLREMETINRLWDIPNRTVPSRDHLPEAWGNCRHLRLPIGSDGWATLPT